jgi:hypothetical protein
VRARALCARDRPFGLAALVAPGLMIQGLRFLV